MYAGQLLMITFLSVAEMSVPTHDAEKTVAPSTGTNGSFSAAALSPTKATAPPPLMTPRRVNPRPLAGGTGPSWSAGGPGVMRFLPTSRGSCHAGAPPTRDPALVKHSCNEIPRPSHVRPHHDDRLRAMRSARQQHQALDDVSKAIISQLQQDGRRSYAAIGKVVGLSEAAVRQRVQRLTDSGVMQVVAVTDPMELGFARQAMVGLRVTGSIEPVADAIAALDEVDYVVVTAGSYDVLAEVVAESDEHLLEIISERIRSIEGVLSTETFMYLHLRKQTYSWGVR